MEDHSVDTVESDHLDSLALATKWSRVGASIIDGFLISIVTLPIAYLMGGFDGLNQEPPVQMSYELQILLLVLGLLFYAAVNWKLLESNGQSIGKKVLNIRIVYLNDEQASRTDILVKRYLPYLLFSYIPFIGPLVSLINLLFIFGKQRRCLHDRIAGTKVVKA
ncbi:RDD family protein [Photobacterium sp. TY1-4]|uniref:RDD family protein n=1 Tax=Photobacterium sp. TY1-4 TaxID=2899122 RepID=UPI0021C1CD74|nr:RDD family protein [Photobacterium sp. TY1-4]UXI03687.1 RDD family protein [Photobacterium sp. TY1-4]